VTQLTLRPIPINSFVHSVHDGGGTHVGNLKRIGEVWKFKAVGYDVNGSVLPGGGPFTERHNTTLPLPNAQALSAALRGPPA
jgi:hypothetical protein